MRDAKITQICQGTSQIYASWYRHCGRAAGGGLAGGGGRPRPGRGSSRPTWSRPAGRFGSARFGFRERFTAEHMLASGQVNW